MIARTARGMTPPTVPTLAMLMSVLFLQRIHTRWTRLTFGETCGIAVGCVSSRAEQNQPAVLKCHVEDISGTDG